MIRNSKFKALSEMSDSSRGNSFGNAISDDESDEFTLKITNDIND